MLYKPEIGESVCAKGRAVLTRTVEIATKECNQSNGFPTDHNEIIFGDTDSVGVDFKIDSVEEADRLGTMVVDKVNAELPAPMCLENEKIFKPFLVLRKKNYAALRFVHGCQKADFKWNDETRKPQALTPGSYIPKLDCKGISIVRSDKIGFVKRIMHHMIDDIMWKNSPDSALQYVRCQIELLLQGKVDVSELIMSKTLSSKAGLTAQSCVAEKIVQRKTGFVPVAGDRIPFVYIKAPKGINSSAMAEDPVWAVKNNLPIDYFYYLEHCVRNEVTRLLQYCFVKESDREKDVELLPIPEKVNALFQNLDHFRPKSVVSAGGEITKFMQRIENRCKSCKVIIDETNRSAKPKLSRNFCNQCDEDKATDYKNHLSEQHKQADKERLDIADICAKCVGPQGDSSVCANLDCKYLFKRMTCRNTVDALAKQIESLQW